MFSCCRRSEGETLSTEVPIKNETSKGWYIAAISVGSLIVISAVVFAVLSHFQASLPSWLARAVGTVANTPYGLGLWGVRLGGILIGGGLIAFGTLKIHQMQKKEKSTPQSEPEKAITPPATVQPEDNIKPSDLDEEEERLYNNSFFSKPPAIFSEPYIATLNGLPKGRFYVLTPTVNSYVFILRANVNLYYTKALTEQEYFKIHTILRKKEFQQHPLPSF